MKKIIANLISDHNRSELLGHWLVKDKYRAFILNVRFCNKT
jgi:hypothetical protein